MKQSGALVSNGFMFLLHMYAFISLYNGSFSIFGFSSAETFFIRATIHFTGTAIVMNKCYVFLARTLNRIFVLLAMLFQYIATIIRGISRTLNTMMELFTKIGSGF